MHARVSQFNVAPEKLNEFTAGLYSSIPLMRQQKGFQALLVLRVEKSDPPDVRVMTIWDTRKRTRSGTTCISTRRWRARWRLQADFR